MEEEEEGKERKREPKDKKGQERKLIEQERRLRRFPVDDFQRIESPKMILNPTFPKRFVFCSITVFRTIKVP